MQKIWSDNDEENFYPNCDVNVWLRSCEAEIIEPLEGTVYGIAFSMFVYIKKNTS